MLPSVMGLLVVAGSFAALALVLLALGRVLAVGGKTVSRSMLATAFVFALACVGLAGVVVTLLVGANIGWFNFN